MQPVDFPLSNRNLQKPADMNDEECGPLPVWTDGKQCVSCWKMTWRERLSALLFGRVWISVISGHTQPPVWLMAAKEVLKKND